MRLFKRGSVYWFELVYDGKRIQKSTRLKNERKAGIIASAFHTALAKGDVGITERKKVPGFAQAMKDFLKWSEGEHLAHPGTAKRYVVSSKALLRNFKDLPIDKITTDLVEKFKAARAAEFTTVRAKDKRVATKTKLRPATVNRELACLKALFNYVIKADLVLTNPVSRVKFLSEQNEQNRVVSYSEQHKYLAKASPMLRDVATMILETGMRPEEVYNLEYEHVRLQEGFLSVPKGKTPAARRRVNLNATARSILEARLESAAGRYVFPYQTDPDRPIPKVNNAHDRTLKESKVKPFRLYDLRHTWATRAAESGVDLVTLASMLGHSRIQMVLRYAHPTQSHQKNAMERIERHNAVQQIREFGIPTTQ